MSLYISNCLRIPGEHPKYDSNDAFAKAQIFSLPMHVINRLKCSMHYDIFSTTKFIDSGLRNRKSSKKAAKVKF